MDYNKQVYELEKYFKSHEKTEDKFRIGTEFEHFVIYKDTLKTVSYYGENGVAETLKDLEKLGYEATYVNGYILGLDKGNRHITLEPGSQFELSIDADLSIKEIENEYLGFMEELMPILEAKGQELLAVGYHPETKIDEIKLLPKKRYDYMFDYLGKRGTHAHNMMKGTAALQVSLDYKDEEDYNKKYRVLSAMSPIMYSMFENSYYFEGKPSEIRNMRSHIWINCDSDRSGILPNALKKDFSYRDYSEYILNRPPIFINKKGEEIYTKEKLVKDVFDPEDYTVEELEHILTMFFPDIRTKRFVEVRMMDSVPYPLNFSAVAMLKGLIYNEENLEKLLVIFKDVTEEDVNKAKEEMMTKGLNASYNGETLLGLGKKLIQLSKDGLSEEEIEYLKPLEEMLEKGMSPYDVTKELAEKGKRESIQWCVLNNIVEG